MQAKKQYLLSRAQASHLVLTAQGKLNTFGQDFALQSKVEKEFAKLKAEKKAKYTSEINKKNTPSGSCFLKGVFFFALFAICFIWRRLFFLHYRKVISFIISEVEDSASRHFYEFSHRDIFVRKVFVQAVEVFREKQHRRGTQI